MRTADLKLNVAYADCNGNRLQLIGPRVEAVWAEVYDTKTAKTVFERLEKTDPWGACGVGTRRGRTNPQLSVKARRFEVDIDGEPVKGDKGTVVLVRPRDIRGTWLEYMSLHAEQVRRDAENRANKVALETFSGPIKDRLVRKTGANRDSVQLHTSWDYKANRYRVTRGAVFFDDPDQLADFLRLSEKLRADLKYHWRDIPG